MSSITVSASARPREDFTCYLPRILCLHGGGTNARIFKAQCRQLSAELKSHFRFIYAEAPWESQAGPDVMAVYGEWGPFKRWLRWSPEHPEITTKEAIEELDKCLTAAIIADDARGATGEVVAVLGFSQGAKVAASLLHRQQVTEKSFEQGSEDRKYRFGVLLAGSAPLVDLNLDGWNHSETLEETVGPRPLDPKSGRLSIPTLHVHGLGDKGLKLHRKLLEDFCEPGSTTLIEWEGDHRVTLKHKDVSLVASHVQKLATLTGVYQLDSF